MRLEQPEQVRMIGMGLRVNGAPQPRHPRSTELYSTQQQERMQQKRAGKRPPRDAKNDRKSQSRRQNRQKERGDAA